MDSKSVSTHAVSLRSVVLFSDSLQSASAIIQVKKESIRLVLIDDGLSQLVGFEEIQFTRPLDPQAQADELMDIIRNSMLNGVSLSAVKWLIESPHFCLLPQSLFDPAHAQMYLEQVTELSHLDQIVFQPVMSDAVLIYAVPAVFLEVAARLFPAIPLQWHSSLSGLIAVGLEMQKESPFLLIQIENKQLFALGFSSGNLLFINRFAYFTENDLLYFSLLALKEMQLEADSSLVLVSGNLQADSLGYEKLNRYLGRMEFVKPIQPIAQPALDLLNKPAYFDLLSNLNL